MACSKFEYVKSFESHMNLLKNTYIAVRIDGHAFHKFTAINGFEKPNDKRAMVVMKEFKDIFIAYGQSDEYSFIFDKSTTLYSRRSDKIATNLVSLFTSAYCLGWRSYFPSIANELKGIPSFDARCVTYPSVKNIRDYLSWRQADCHINNLYNTAFWALVQNKTINDPSHPLKTNTEAECILKVLDSGGKNELLFSQYGINYNNIDPMFRKGTTLVREPVLSKEISLKTGQEVERMRTVIVEYYEDVIGNDFWKARQSVGDLMT